MTRPPATRRSASTQAKPKAHAKPKPKPKAHAKARPKAKPKAQPKAHAKPKPKQPPAPRQPAAKPPSAPRRYGPRADLGAPVDAFFARQPPALRPLVDALSALIAKAAPDAISTLKWGMPVYSIGPTMMCAIGAHAAHVNLILAGPPDAFPDPAGRLAGTGKTGRHLKLRALSDLPRPAVQRWLRIAAEHARR